MKKITIKNVLVFMLCFLGLLLFPYVINTIIWIICFCIKAPTAPQIEMETWCSLISIALPAALTYAVLRQSELQQEKNEQMQERLEHLNEKMFETELKSKIGYFLPIVDDEIVSGIWEPHRYNLTNGIDLYHTGDDIVFIIEACYVLHGEKKYIANNQPVCFLDKPSFNRYIFTPEFSADDLTLHNISIDIELTLRNSKNYTYKQIINLGFENNRGSSIITCFNMNIQEVD